MRKLGVTIAGLFIALQSFGQSKLDTALIAYAKSKGYVQITDSVHLPKVIRPYYDDVARYFGASSIDMKAMYVSLKHVSDTPTLLKVYLEDISTIAQEKKNDELNTLYRAHPDTVIMRGKKTVAYKMALLPFGNTSGHDGELWINKGTRHIGFLLGE